jgi:phosphatidylglycerophosphatase C
VSPLLRFLAGGLDRGGLKGAVLQGLFGGVPRERIERWAERFVAASVPARMHADGLATLDAHLRAGDHVVVLSASPDLFVPAIARRLGAHEVHCTAIRWDGNRLDGRLAGQNRRDAEKVRVLRSLREAHPGLPVIAYGNSAADLPHMRLCEEAVYINASAALAAQLQAAGIQSRRWR